MLISLFIGEVIFRLYYLKINSTPSITEDDECKLNIYRDRKHLVGTGNFYLNNPTIIEHSIYGWTLKP